jgi:hypothetical protein
LLAAEVAVAIFFLVVVEQVDIIYNHQLPFQHHHLIQLL